MSALLYNSIDLLHVHGQRDITIRKLIAPLVGIKCMEQYEETKSFWTSYK